MANTQSEIDSNALWRRKETSSCWDVDALVEVVRGSCQHYNRIRGVWFKRQWYTRNRWSGRFYPPNLPKRNGRAASDCIKWFVCRKPYPGQHSKPYLKVLMHTELNLLHRIGEGLPLPFMPAFATPACCTCSLHTPAFDIRIFRIAITKRWQNWALKKKSVKW